MTMDEIRQSDKVALVPEDGQQYESFTRKMGRKVKKYVQYDYRHTDLRKRTRRQCKPVDTKKVTNNFSAREHE